MAACKQIRQVVDKIGAAGDGRAQRVFRKLPAVDAVPVGQQRTIEAAQSGRISKVDGRLSTFALADKSL